MYFFSQIQPIQILYRSETHKIRKILTVDLKDEGLLSLQMNIVFRRFEVLHYISAPLSLLFTRPPLKYTQTQIYKLNN